MAENERDSLGDLELEITDLDPTPRRRPLWNIRWTPRWRRWSVVVTSIVFLLLVGLFLDSISDVRSLLAQTFFQPAPAVPPNTMEVYLQGNPSWGTFSLDGELIAHLPIVGHDKPLDLSPGSHTITWRIALLHTQSCVFTVMDSATLDSPCLHNGRANESTAFTGQVLLSFFASARDLPAAQHAALVKQLQAFMAAYGGSEQVHQGELYAVSEQQAAANPALCTEARRATFCAAQATQQLQATLHVQLDTSTSSTDPCIASEQCFISGQDCRQLCADPNYSDYSPPTAFSSQGWHIFIVLNFSWSYTTLSGQVVANNLPDIAMRGETSFQTMPIQLIPAGRSWRIIPYGYEMGEADRNPVCDQVANDTNELSSTSTINEEMLVQQVIDLQGDAASGCLLVFTPSPGTSPLNPSTPISGIASSQVAYCLVRFGVVLTVNHFAQQVWPFLPLVDSYENSLAQQLITDNSLSDSP